MTIRSSISEIHWKNSESVASLFLAVVLLLADISLFDTVKILIVSHRLSTVDYCDRLYKIENDRITEEGSFHEVVQRLNTNK